MAIEIVKKVLNFRSFFILFAIITIAGLIRLMIGIVIHPQNFYTIISSIVSLMLLIAFGYSVFFLMGEIKGAIKNG